MSASQPAKPDAAIVDTTITATKLSMGNERYDLPAASMMLHSVKCENFVYGSICNSCHLALPPLPSAIDTVLRVVDVRTWFLFTLRTVPSDRS